MLLGFGDLGLELRLPVARLFGGDLDAEAALLLAPAIDAHLDIAAELDSAALAKLTVAEMLKRRILINCTSDTVLRFLPPYILERKHVDQTIDALDQIQVQRELAAEE